MISRRESREQDSYIDEDEDSLLEAEREEMERAALVELELAKSKPVAFAVRANISFDGTQANLNAPAPERVASFAAKDFIHVKQRYDPFWWIGRVIKNNSPLCYVPSPAKLDELRMPALHMEWANNSNGDTINRMNNKAGRPMSESTGEFYDEENEEGLNDPNGPVSPGSTSTRGPGGQPGGIRKHPGPGGPNTPGPGAIPKKKNFFRKGEQPPYEVVPIMRPIVFIGPALKGYDITDMMQKAIFDFLKRHFENRLLVSRISTDISIAKRVGTLQNIDSKKGAMDKNRGRQISALLEVQQELERIFDLASTMQLVVLDCDTVNHPGQVLKTSLAPIVIYIKIASVRVLQKLIKTRDKDQKKNAGVQVAAAEKLLLCPPENFDLVIDQNTLEAACEALKTYLENYWSMTHPPVQSLPLTKADKLFANQDKQNHFTPQHPPSGPIFGPDGEMLSSQVPMHPGRPGVMSMSSFALHAGFSAQEISALAGARSGWPGAYPEASLNPMDQDGAESHQGLINGRMPMAVPGRTMINDSSDARAKALMIVQKQQQINNQEQAKQIHLVNAPGLHQVPGGVVFGNEASDTPIVFQSRSARQAKQREIELERARKAIEAELNGKKRRNRNNPLKTVPL